MFATVNLLQSLTTISLLIGIVGVAGAVFSFLRYNNYKETVRIQDDNIRALNELLNTHAKQITDQGKEIEILKARNLTLETVPLGKILESLSVIQKTTLAILSNQNPNVQTVETK